MSGTHNEITSLPGTEEEIAAAVVFLKARARHFGKDGIPLAVRLSPLSPDAGWRQAAIEWIEEAKKARQRGTPLPLGAPPQPQGAGLMTDIGILH